MEDIICCIQVKEYDRKRGRAQSALAEQNWAEAEQLFSDALHVSSVLYCINVLWEYACRPSPPQTPDFSP